MTRADVIELVRQRLGFNRRMTDTQILQNMDYVQLLYELGHDNMPLPWFAFSASATITTTAGQRHVNLPDDFVQFDDDWPLSIAADDGILYGLKRETAYNLQPIVNEGMQRPKYFEADGLKLYLYPTPDVAYTITIPHYVRTPALSLTEDSAWFTNFPALLAEETANSIMRSARDLEGLRLSNVNALRSDYIRRVEARKHELKSYESA
jgi:hypothetical protein